MTPRWWSQRFGEKIKEGDGGDDLVFNVDGSQILCSPIEVGSLSHYFQGFLHHQVVVWDFFRQPYVNPGADVHRPYSTQKPSVSCGLTHAKLPLVVVAISTNL